MTEKATTPAAKVEAWRGFTPGLWQRDVNVRWFIQQNFTLYDGDEKFLSPPTERTRRIWKRLEALFVEERKKGVLDISQVPSSITAHAPGYIDRDSELIVGLQTDAPLKRAIMPNGGLRMVLSSLKAYGVEPSASVVETFSKYRKTHNEGVFDAYTPDIRNCRSSHILTGLPDAYGRGRIIGDYRRVALYGVARLIQQKQREKAALDAAMSTEEIIRDREELSEQMRALQELQTMAQSYGFDISGPARTAREAVQWLYFGYLAAVKEQNGAAMSLGRTSTFLDIYFARDLADGTLTEEQAQEIIDDFVIKLRIVRFLRTPEYDELFAGDPTWVTESIGGMGDDGRPLVTKSSFRFLHTLYNLGPAPEPNLTICKHPTYRHALHTQSVLTITSNVVYGKNTGHTPDGRRKGEPFAPGANPMHGRDTHGIMASAASVAKIPYRDAADGISLTATLVPEGLGRTSEDQVGNMVGMLDAFFGATGYHANVNVLNRAMLLDAMEHPEKYPQLTIRVSGYAVNFVRLTREQQMDVVNRTFHSVA